MGVPHERRTLAEFQDGETRLVYARHKKRPLDPPYFLVDGTAHQVRDWAREHLECLIPDCPDPALKVVARTRRRDGFSHHAGAGRHAPESLGHRQGKALIQRWVSDNFPDVEVNAEEVSPNGERRSDVMLTFPGGRKVAIEVQYKAITPTEWQTRHNSYAAQGIVDVWLLGHSGDLLRHVPPRVGEDPAQMADRIMLGPLHEAIAAASAPLLWLHPVLELIGTAWVHRGPSPISALLGEQVRWNDGHESLRLPVPASRAGVATFGAVPLRGCQVSPDGLAVPAFLNMNANLARLAQIEAARRKDDRRRNEPELRRRQAQVRERERVLAQAREQQAAAAARRAALDRQRRHADASHLRRWESSDLYARIMTRHGRIPALVTQPSRPTSGVRAAPAHWRAHAYEDLRTRPARAPIPITDIYQSITRSFDVDVSTFAATVRAWLDYLAAEGMVQFVYGRGSRSDDVVAVTCPASLPALTDAPLAASAISTLRCIACRGQLDPVLRDTGRHLSC